MTGTRKTQDFSFLKRLIVLHVVVILFKILMRFVKKFHFSFVPVELPLNSNNKPQPEGAHYQYTNFISVWAECRLQEGDSHTQAQAENILTAHLGWVSKESI